MAAPCINSVKVAVISRLLAVLSYPCLIKSVVHTALSNSICGLVATLTKYSKMVFITMVNIATTSFLTSQTGTLQTLGVMSFPAPTSKLKVLMECNISYNLFWLHLSHDAMLIYFTASSDINMHENSVILSNNLTQRTLMLTDGKTC